MRSLRMLRGRVVDLDADLAVAAAAISAETGLAMAGSVVQATAREAEARLWTQDPDFEGMERVEYRGRAQVPERLPTPEEH